MTQDPAVLQKALEQCEREPIQIPGAIQSHGILITLRSSDFTILQISESVFDILGVHSSELLHQPLSKLMPIEPVERATKRLGDRLPRLLNPLPLDVMVRGKQVRLDGILHRSGRVLILELERHIDEDKGYGGFGGFYEAIREVASKLMVTENLSEVLELACQELRKLTGFSRVLAYKFDDDWNGEVVNESKDDDIASLLHHHFPASDIPKQARELYTTNWLRLIPNVDYVPSKIVPAINPITDKPLDLSNSVLRSVSPVHLEYMRNMGQAASMSVSLLKGRKLWGLISCHHPEAHYLKYDVRVASEFIGQMVSAQIVAREESTEVDHKLQLKKLYDDLLKNGGGYSAIQRSFSTNASSLMGLVEAEGAALCFGGRSICIGATPSHDELELIRHWVVNSPNDVVMTESVRTQSSELKMVSSVANGVLAINIANGANRDCIIWFRPESRARTKWAGDPGAAKLHEAGRIHPRSSFETWYENSAGKSAKWKSLEIDAAMELRESLIAMQLGYASSVPPNDRLESFRDSLSNSIATTAATKRSREPGANEVTHVSTATEAAQNSRLLLEGFSEFAVLFLDLNGQIQNWSAGARRLLGYSKTEVIGKSINVFFPEEDVLKEKHNRVLQHVREYGRCEEELWLYRSDQTSFWGKIMVAQVNNEKDESIGFSIVIQDVTKEKSAEEELKSTKLSAEAANRAKTAFLANVSHEIRTPLGAVLGFSELMTSTKLTDEERLTLYSKVRRNGEQLTVLINDLLDIGKAEAGKIEVENIRLDLNLLLSDIEQLFALKTAEKGVSFKISIRGEVPKFIYSDPTRLKQIVINMLSNAIKFTPSGGSVSVEASIEKMADAQVIAFRVTDTGRGMTEKEMERLFKPFVQADASTTRMYGGTGLGLFLSQRLARSLGGDLTIEWTEPGKGTRFLAFIDPGPINGVQTISKVEHLATNENITAIESDDIAGLNILVVDDSIDNRELLTTYLRKAGAKVSLAENGQVGVETAMSERFDLILLDIQMPVLDGNRAMRELLERGSRVPVIALTAHAMKEERDYSLAMGFTDYLTKPIDRKLLIERIRSIVKSAKK